VLKKMAKGAEYKPGAASHTEEFQYSHFILATERLESFGVGV
jgi:hypothetical protein